MNRQLFMGIILAIAVVLPVIVLADLTPLESRKPLPQVALIDSKGASVNLSAYKGRVVLLDFWATWCEGCKEEIPWFMEFQTKYNKSGLTVVGASLDDDGWKSGKIADIHPGMVDKAAFESEIQALLKETSTKPVN